MTDKYADNGQTVVSNLDKLIATVAHLRSPEGCPWDREQTHASLARYLLEEAYEVLEAIHLDDNEKLKEELGDLLLQVVLNAQLAKDEGRFDIDDVACAINEKMIRRHPHVFADTTCASTEAVLAQWDNLKAIEQKNKPKSVLDGVNPTAPALMQALKISEKAVAQGFEWPSENDIWLQLTSELAEFKQAVKDFQKQKSQINSPSKVDMNLELGDILFTVVNIGRFHGLNAEESLLAAVKKFKDRFSKMEQLAPCSLKELSISQWEKLWVEAKIATNTLDIL
jgi:tetrapyrrole methylase family protein/MazG family protein